MTKFCVHSQTGVSIVDARGGIRPCCKFANSQLLPTIFDVDSLNGMHYKEPYSSIKNDLNHGKFPHGCKSCERSEQAGLQSRRQFTNKMFGKHDLFKPTYIQDLEISLDYTCNMMCRICNPSASSKWGSAKTVIEQFQDNDIKIDNNTDYRTYQDRFRQVFENTDLSRASHVKLEGGEPFYAKNFEWFLDKLDREVIDKEKLFLNITTNGSVYPDKKIIEKLKKFNKWTTIAFSLDAADDLADCIRWGVPWKQIADNVRRFKQDGFHCLASCTVSILNFNRLHSLMEFCDTNNIRISFSELTDPRYLSMYQLPIETRQQYLTGKTSLDRIINADINIESEFDKLYKSIIILDDYQKIKFGDVNPEIWELINANIG